MNCRGKVPPLPAKYPTKMKGEKMANKKTKNPAIKWIIISVCVVALIAVGLFFARKKIKTPFLL